MASEPWRERPDQAAWRRKFGVLAPSTNSMVEYDFNSMRVPGVVPLFSRIHITDPDLSTPAQMEKLRVQLDESIDYTTDLVCTAQVDTMVGMSAGPSGAARATALQSASRGGLPVATGAGRAAGAERLGVSPSPTPYQPNGDEQVDLYFSECGFEVRAVKGLKRPTAWAIAETTEDELRDALLELNETGADALVQVGTNMGMVRLAAEAERWLGKPVLAINAATWWQALRMSGIDDGSSASAASSKSSDRSRRRSPISMGSCISKVAALLTAG
jgi:maleate isomerase